MYGEMRRQGEFGDEHVRLEERLITASLNAYRDAEREQDVPVPRELFELIASQVLGGTGKRAHVQVLLGSLGS